MTAPRRRHGAAAARRGGGIPPAPPARRRLRGWFIGDEPDFRVRGLWLLLAFVAMAIILAGRLVDVQLRQGPHLSALAAAAHKGQIVLPAHRGRILDRNGRLIASDLPVYAVFADPGLIPEAQRHDIASRLAPILQMGPARIEDLLAQPTRFVYLAHQVSEDTKSRLAALGISSIGTLPEEQRYYAGSAVPGVSFASNLIGYVDHDGHGQYGVEQYYDTLLRGQDGLESQVVDLNHNAIVLSSEQQRDARDGMDLRLGLDPQAQYYAEQALADGVNLNGAESGTLMIMDTHTGAIRAWADYPSYDANHYGSTTISLFRDAAVSDLYEPGSVMKAVTFAGGINASAITPDTSFDEQAYSLGGYVIHDWDGRLHGHVTMQYVLENSLNNGAVRVMEMMGIPAFFSNLLTFGMGAPTGIDVANEHNQPLRPQTDYSQLDTAEMAFGQTIQVTPVEMLGAINAIGNGGVWVQPHAVEATVDPITGAQTPFQPTTRRVISPQADATLTHMMTGVVDSLAGLRGPSGFAVSFATNDHDPQWKQMIAGKTGTADVARNGHYGAGIIGSFAGFLPADHPQFTMMVILRMPQHCTFQGHGSPCEGAYIAAPIWHQMARLLVDTWKITP